MKTKKLKILKLSKDSQKQILGGAAERAYNCTNDSCSFWGGAMDRVITYHYKTNQ